MRKLATLLMLVPSICLSQGADDCLDFDGTNDFVNGYNAAITSVTNTFTVEFWYYTTNTITVKAEQNGVSDISGTTGNGQLYALYPRHGGGGCGVFGNAGMGVSVGTNAIQVYEHRACYMPCLLSYSGTIPAGWNHIAVVYDNKTPTLYLNGVNVRTGLTSGQNNVFPSVRLGGNTYGWFAGNIDEFRIWSEARTQDEIRNHMCESLTGSETNLVRCYELNDGAGTTATDLSGTQNGTLTNMTPASDWITSGASIGDNSMWVYPSDWSQTALDFDGIDDHVVIGDPAELDFDNTDAFSIEAWAEYNGSGSKMIFSKMNNAAPFTGYELFVNNGQVVVFLINTWTSNTIAVATSAAVMTAGTWHHVAMTYDGGSDASGVNIYVDGTSYALTTFFNSLSGSILNNDNANLGMRSGNAFYWNGGIDEVRVWDKELSVGEINNNMCRALRGTEANLVGYWKLNDGAGTTATDHTSAGNDGTLTSMAPASDWIASSATCAWTGLSLIMSSTESDSLGVSSVAGTPDGVIIYNEQQFPNTLTGTNGVQGSNNNYFGVYKIGGAAPTYTATYYYAENDAVQGSAPVMVEADLRLYRRDDNLDATWANTAGTVNTTANTITATAQSTEFILGILGTSPLDVDLLEFEAKPEANEVDLIWRTSSETNNDYFTIEKSVDGENFELLAIVNGAGTSLTPLSYLEKDLNPNEGWNYYRLTQTDFDGTTEDHGTVTAYYEGPDMDIAVYPNPSHDGSFTLTLSDPVEGASLVIVDALGREVLSERLAGQQHVLPAGQLAAGTYMVNVWSSNQTWSTKLIVR